MKPLIESLFDDKLVEKDLFDNPEFKHWLNQPNTLWYIFYYWESGEEDWLNDFMNDEWETYRPFVDELLKIINSAAERVMGKKKYTWDMINFDMYEDNDSIQNCFPDYNAFEDSMNDAIYEIVHKASEVKDGISKVWFKGDLPKNSNVTILLQELNLPIASPNKLNGGIFLTNEDTIMILGFPRGLDKKILNLFNIN